MKQNTIDNLVVVGIAVVLVGLCFVIDTIKATLIAVTLCAFYAITAVYWKRRWERWLWYVLVPAAAVHVIAIILLHGSLPTGPALAYVTPIMFADAFALYGLVRFADTFASRGK